MMFEEFKNRHFREGINRKGRRTSLSVRVGVDFANQEAALVKLPVGLLGDTNQRVSSRAQALHGVGGGVCPDGVRQLRHRLQLLFITLEDHSQEKQ